MILSQHVEVGIAMRLLAETPEGLGYLLKDRVTAIEDFTSTLRRVAAGGSALDPKVIDRLLASRRDEGPLSALSAREREVLSLIAEGLSNRGDRRPARDHRGRRAEARARGVREARPRARRRGASPRPGRADVLVARPATVRGSAGEGESVAGRGAVGRGSGCGRRGVRAAVREPRNADVDRDRQPRRPAARSSSAA